MATGHPLRCHDLGVATRGKGLVKASEDPRLGPSIIKNIYCFCCLNYSNSDTTPRIDEDPLSRVKLGSTQP